MRILLPFPNRKLSPNARGHWASKIRLRNEAKDIGRFCAMAALEGRPFELVPPYKLTLTIYPPDKRRRDTDNVIAALKASLDGVAAGLGVDDALFRNYAVWWEEPVRGGKVAIDITELR